MVRMTRYSSSAVALSIVIVPRSRTEASQVVRSRARPRARCGTRRASRGTARPRRACATGNSCVALLRRMQHHADRAVAALGEGLPGLGEALERVVVGHEAVDVDGTAREQGEGAPGDALRVRERPEYVEVAAHDRREVEPRELGAGAGRS